MAKKTSTCPDFIKKMDWPQIIFLLFLVTFLAGLTFKHYFTQQQQLRWQKLEALQAAEMALIKNIDISDELLKKADLDENGLVDQNDVSIMQEAFLDIDSDSLQADLNLDGRVDTKDYAILVHIINTQELADPRNE